MTPPAPKVSVVVATYRSGDGLDRLVASLDAQSMPREDWEVVFVDDGSPDDTWERLQAIRDARPNVRLERIENSGWPCRPRNVGTDLARGEYIAFMDHDDELYPNALRDGYAFATRHGADVVNGKEARTHDPSWAIPQFQEDRAQALGDPEMYPLSPTNPHKLYRREFLNEHGIRFREGGRVLWEDVFFNVLVGRHAKVVSTMASTPYYHWFATPGSGSTSFLRSRPEWWYWLDEMISAISTDLAGDDLALQRELLLAHQYRARLMDAFNNRYEIRPAAERKMIFEYARRIQSDYFPEEADAALNRTLVMRAQLLRKGHPHLLERLTVDDPNIPGTSQVTRAQWEAGKLKLETRADWVDSKGRRQRFVVRDGRYLKDLAPQYSEVFAPELLDMTDDLKGASLTMGVRSVDSRLTWMVPSTSEAWLRADPSPRWGVRGTAVIDPETAAMGAALDRGVWELNGRCVLAGTPHQPLSRATALVPAIHIDHQGCAAVYARPDGIVVLDFDQTETPLPHLVVASGRVRHSREHLEVELRGLPTDVDAEFDTEVSVDLRGTVARLRSIPGRLLRRITKRGHGGSRSWQVVPASIRISGGSAVLRFAVPAEGPVRIRLGERVPGSAAVQGLNARRTRVSPRSGLLHRLLG